MEIKNNRVCSTLILLLLCVEVPAKSDELPIQIETQQTDSWCWAASSVALLNRYQKYPGIDVEQHPERFLGQCLLVTKMFELDGVNIDCCVPGNEAVCEESAYDADTKAIVNSYPYNMNMIIEGSLSEQDIDTLINSRKAPFIMGLEGADDGHNVIGIALSSDKKKLTVMDPWDGTYRKETIVNWKSGNTNDGRPWVTTLDWAQANAAPVPPDDVTLRHTTIARPNDYAFVSIGTLVTEAFTLESGAKAKFLTASGDPIVMKKGTTLEKGAKLCASRSNWCSY